jgi:hypothetical protein
MLKNMSSGVKKEYFDSLIKLYIFAKLNK